MNEEDQKAKG